MVNEEEANESPTERKQPNPVAGNGQNTVGLFSPRFKSAAAMAGWDEEAILVATLVVEDTPDRETKYRKRTDLQFKTPPSNSRRKRRTQRRSPVSIPVPVLDLDEEESSREENDKKNVQLNEEKETKEEKRVRGDKSAEQNTSVSCSNSVLPCMDKLREELSCAICLEICFEPSTTSCGHSFCKKCLRSAADKCGKKCPKCRQLISNGRSCTVNTVLWNTIQLLFPQEVEARKAAGALNSQEAEHQSQQRGLHNNVRTRSMRAAAASTRDANMMRREIPSQDEEVDSTRRPERENLALLLSRASETQEVEHQSLQRGIHSNTRTRSIRPPTVSTRDSSMRRRRMPSQDEDAALALRLERENLARLLSRDASTRRRGMLDDEDAMLALRLQREEFMGAFRGTNESRSSLLSARANLRAMASRAISIRMRGRPL
ncbi:Zinc finger, RING-type [Melia azedarach]|uniref:Zinc finger, RING-type n=1 Tax=Melia azedarach TaxID=155640 RepID=A0ACC1Z083_MELAZ|nr:Zinc finger, RING-type [Melia azedarach]